MQLVAGKQLHQEHQQILDKDAVAYASPCMEAMTFVYLFLYYL